MQPISEDPELLQAFLVESHELLQGLDHDLVKLESTPTDQELLNQAFRALHTIKGTASLLKLEPIVRVGHCAEDVLSGIRQGRLQLTGRIMDALLAARDQLGAMLADLHAGGLKEYALDALLSELQRVQSAEASPKPIEHRDDALPSGKADTANHEQKDAASPQDSAATAVQSMRVDVRKLDELINLIGELVLERNRLLQLAKEISSGQAPAQTTDSPLLHSALRLSGADSDSGLGLQNRGNLSREQPPAIARRALPEAGAGARSPKPARVLRLPDQ